MLVVGGLAILIPFLRSTKEAGPASSDSPRGCLRCDGKGTVPSEQTVEPAPDGVHIVVENTSGGPLRLAVRNVGGSGVPEGTTEIPPATGGDAWPIPPGTYELACMEDSLDSRSGPWARLLVVDPRRTWISSELGCGSRSGFLEPAHAFPDRGTPASIARDWIEKKESFPAGYKLERAGYPEAHQPIYRATVGADVVARFRFAPAGEDAWYFEEALYCTDLADMP
jgi:hypothetical protein